MTSQSLEFFLICAPSVTAIKIKFDRPLEFAYIVIYERLNASMIWRHSSYENMLHETTSPCFRNTTKNLESQRKEVQWT